MNHRNTLRSQTELAAQKPFLGKKMQNLPEVTIGCSAGVGSTQITRTLDVNIHPEAGTHLALENIGFAVPEALAEREGLMSISWRPVESGDWRNRRPRIVPEADAPDELERLRRENRRLAVSLGSFSAFIASKGMLEEAWSYVNAIHQLDDD